MSAAPENPAAPTVGEDAIPPPPRRDTYQSDDSQTAAEFLQEQLQMEADAREAMPYSITTCTNPLGPLRQSVYACLTCNPPGAAGSQPAGMCYACSVQCHGAHTLVEIFQKRSFTCDCGTTRFPNTAPCALRLRPGATARAGVASQPPDANNQYNQNFANRFCACSCDYDPFQQRGTMFQCLGLGSAGRGGGCGEDWYHPGCLVGMGPEWFKLVEGGADSNKKKKKKKDRHGDGGDAMPLPVIAEEMEGVEQGEAYHEDDGNVGDVGGDGGDDDDDDDDDPMPPGFPAEDDFEGFICYKCVDANPWIKQYAGTAGFLPPVYLNPSLKAERGPEAERPTRSVNPKKRGPDEEDVEASQTQCKRHKSEAPSEDDTAADRRAETHGGGDKTPHGGVNNPVSATCKLLALPAAPAGPFSLFFADKFREFLCRCPPCHRRLDAHPQLLEEEDVYEPPLSTDGGESRADEGSVHGSGSLLERGESALRNIDRVQAIEGVMAYNHLKEQLKPFFAQFAGTGRAISAEDIKEYFARLRGDEGAMREASDAARRGGSGGGSSEEDRRREQRGY